LLHLLSSTAVTTSTTGTAIARQALAGLPLLLLVNKTDLSDIIGLSEIVKLIGPAMLDGRHVSRMLRGAQFSLFFCPPALQQPIIPTTGVYSAGDVQRQFTHPLLFSPLRHLILSRR